MNKELKLHEEFVDDVVADYVDQEDRSIYVSEEWDIWILIDKSSKEELEQLLDDDRIVVSNSARTGIFNRDEEYLQFEDNYAFWIKKDDEVYQIEADNGIQEHEQEHTLMI